MIPAYVHVGSLIGCSKQFEKDYTNDPMAASGLQLCLFNVSVQYASDARSGGVRFVTHRLESYSILMHFVLANPEINVLWQCSER